VTPEVQVDNGLWANADPRRIRQVLENLIANALRYSPLGSKITV
jgi:signal transduction histidine kinase